MITLRRNSGSYDRVERVLGYDPGRLVACCLLKDFYGYRYLDCIDMSELEAVHDDPAQTFADVKAEVSRRAEYKVRNHDIATAD